MSAFFHIFPRLTALLLFCGTAQAGLVEDYEQERRRLLQQPFEHRLEALQAHRFDVSTVLGQYFYNTVLINSEPQRKAYTLDAQQLAQLQQAYPTIYYEREVFEVWQGPLPEAQKIAQLKDIKQLAEQKNWPRIMRWAASALIAVYQNNSYHISAVIEIQAMLDQAIHIDKVEVLYDYALLVAYHDMAVSMHLLGNYTDAIEYCEKARAYLPEDPQVQFQSLSCMVKAAVKKGDFEATWPLLSELEALGNRTQLKQFTLHALNLAAFAHREAGQFELALAYATDALDFQHTHEFYPPGARALTHLMLASVHIKLNDPNKARSHYEASRKHRLEADQGTRVAKDDALAEARIAHLEGDLDAAARWYEQLHELHQQEQTELFSPEQFAQLAQELDSRQLAVMQMKARLHQSREEKMTLVALFSSVLAAVAGILLWRAIRRKREIEQLNQLDSLTGLPNRWFALEQINQQLHRLNTHAQPLCVALLEIDNFAQLVNHYGSSTGDALIRLFARQTKYQFRRSDLFARYGGDEFVLMLPHSELEDARQKILQLKTLLGHRSLDEVGAKGELSFCCGLLEVRSKAPVAAVLAQCDSLLYRACHQGPDSLCSGRFAAADDVEVIR